MGCAQDQARKVLQMRERGYSLVEMVVVIGIMSILLAIVTINFPEYLKRYRTEAQTRMIYEELLKARANSVYQRRATLVKLFPAEFRVYSSTSEGAAPMYTQALAFPVQCNGSGNPTDGYTLGFDSRGLSTSACSICVAPDNSSAVDSIVISDLQVRIGKKDKGDDCKADNIKIR